jgi:predicted naringenin-chalcone synthase
MINKMHQAVDLPRNSRRMNMKSAIGLAAIAMALILSASAEAHSLRVECEKLNDDNVVCRSLFSDGEVARNMLVQLIDENDRVVASGRTDTEGKYAFKAPGAEYNVVVEANKGHVASMSSEDIW